MSGDQDRLLSFTVNGTTIGVNLQRAIASGKVVRRDDGKFELSHTEDRTAGAVHLDGYIHHKGDFSQPCVFLNLFMFQHVYAEGMVPFGCRDCFKVRVVTESLQQMMAVREIAESVSATSKTGVELRNQQHQPVYGSFFYTLGLDRARALYRDLRAKINEHGKLGSGVKMLIKRGCTNYERKCGPSDRYTFDPQQEEIERHFFARFAADVRLGVRKSMRDALQILEWGQFAARVADNTHKNFNDDSDRYPPVVTYPPEE
jgi:hypothetical protein